MGNRIRLLLEYGALPLFIYEEDDVFGFWLPKGHENDQELIKLTEEVQNIYNSLWIDERGKKFEYKGFDTTLEEEHFKKLVRELRDMLVRKFSHKYIIDVSDVEEYL